MPYLLKLENIVLFVIFSILASWSFLNFFIYKEISKQFLSVFSAIVLVTSLIVAHMLVQQWKIKDTDGFATYLIVIVGILFLGTYCGYHALTDKFPIRP